MAAAVTAALVVAVGGAATPAIAESPIHVWEALHMQEKSTPGMYAYPASTPNYTDLKFNTTVTLDPGPNGDVFWAHEFHSNGSPSVSGYIGTQTSGDGTGNFTWRFSVWGATACEINPLAGLQGDCGLPDGAPGASATISYPMVIGRAYVLRISAIPNRPGWWNGSLVDSSSGTSVSIGNVKVPNGISTISPSDSFVEYWNWNYPDALCINQADSAATYGPITGDGGTIRYASTSTSSTCTYADRHGVGPQGSAYLAAYPKAIPLASQSSNYFSDGYTGAADKAIDGNPDGNFHDLSVTHTREELHASWQGNLGTVAYVNQITLYPRTDCCPERLSDFWVCTSVAPFPPGFTAGNQAGLPAGVTCYRVMNVAPYTSPVRLDGQLKGRARYVEVQLAGTGYLSLAEVQVI